MHIIQHYQKYVASDEGLDVYMHWLEKLKDTREARINSSRRAITRIGRSAALVFLQISRYLLQKPPCSPSQFERRASTRINPRFPSAKIAIVRRVARMEIGNFGDHKFCRNGVWELRIDVGAGYRVYDAIAGKRLFCCCAAATNERRMQTLIVPVNTGATGRLERGQRGQAS